MDLGPYVGEYPPVGLSVPMKKLRVLIVLPDPPLPFGNAGARWFYVLLKELVARGHRVTVFSGCAHPGDLEKVSELFSLPKFDVRCFPSGAAGGLAGRWGRLSQPYSYLFGPALRAALENEIRLGYDILHLEQLWSGWLGIAHRRQTLINVHYSFSVDQSGHRPQGLKDRLLRLHTRRAENYLLRHYRHICTLSDRLKDFVRSVNPTASLHTVPLGLDASLYPFEEPRAIDPVVGLIGSFNWSPSFLAAQRLLDRLWPAIRARRPDAQLLIVGRQAQAAFGVQCRDDAQVQIEENVPDIIPYFEKCRLCCMRPPSAAA